MTDLSSPNFDQPESATLWNAYFSRVEKLTQPLAKPQRRDILMEIRAHLLESMLDIETACGRVRAGTGAARTLDLDLILYGDETIDEPGWSCLIRGSGNASSSSSRSPWWQGTGATH